MQNSSAISLIVADQTSLRVVRRIFFCRAYQTELFFFVRKFRDRAYCQRR